MSRVAKVKFVDYRSSITKALDLIGAGAKRPQLHRNYNRDEEYVWYSPGTFYAGSWNKSKLHSPSTDKSVVDVCLYKKPNLSVVDASDVARASPERDPVDSP
jgi:hypothetical protein